MAKQIILLLVIICFSHLELSANNSIAEKMDTFPNALSDTVVEIGEKKLLTIGNTMPDIQFEAMNAGAKTHKLSDYRGKLIIVDFWNIWCAACLTAMPEMEKLQNEFGDKIVVLLVTANTKAQVEKLKSRNKILQAVRLPIITDDKLFSDHFNMMTFPTHVWIDSAGIIRQITNGYNTTAFAVREWLAGNKKTLVVKKELTDYNLNAPIWEEGKGRNLDKIKFYSLITSRIDYSSGGGSHIDSISGKPVWVHMVNSSIYDLYVAAYCMKFAITDQQFVNRSVFTSRKMNKIKVPQDILLQDRWAEENTWCYEIQVPSEKAAQLPDIMLQDLDRYFGLRNTIKRKKVKCWVLKKITPNTKLKMDLVPIASINQSDPNLILVSRRPIQYSLLLELQAIKKNEIVIDDTNDNTSISMILHIDKKNPTILSRSLREHGLKLVIESRYVDFFEIKDK